MKKSCCACYMILPLLLVVQVLVLSLLGQVPYCSSGFSIWIGDAWNRCTSQDIFDPYSFTHIEHGILLYWIVTFLNRLTGKQKLILVVLIEVCWEILENTPLIINRYRTATASLDYFGDSIVNSLGDTASCLFGTLVAWRLPVRWTIFTVLAIELLLLAVIRDNLTLNILMLFYPIQAIKAWQVGVLKTPLLH